jgi:hypothetical protein
MSEAYSELKMGTMGEGVARRTQDVLSVGHTQEIPLECRLVELVGAGHNVTLTLPPVNLARGMFIVIRFISHTASNEVLTVQDYGDDSNWSNVVMDDDGDWLMVYSDGHRWIDIGCSCGNTTQG